MTTQTSTAAPPISVVVASKVGPPFIDQCLNSLECEARELGAEVIVVTSQDESYMRRLAGAFPWVRVVNTSEKEVPALRRRGVEEAKSEWVAIIEEHCAARGDWLHRAVAALSNGRYSAAGGPIVDDNYDTLRDWVVYFCEYNSAMPPAPRGETRDLNDANIAYPRSVLMEHRELLDQGYWPMTLHGHLLAKGHRFVSVPDMVVYHRGPFQFAYYLGQRYLFSRAYTGVRAQRKAALWRLTYLIAAPLIPFMLLARMARNVFSKGCRSRQFILALPLTITALVVLVAGEWVGCLLGPGDALSRVE
jgi:hypothetical protein